MAVLNLTPAEQGALEGFVRDVRAAFGERLERLVLFGSRARGEGDEESDLDVLVLLRGATREDQLRIYDLAYDRYAEAGVDISPLVRTPEDFARLRAQERRIALEVEREGVPL
jgi:hypothetical protein